MATDRFALIIANDAFEDVSFRELRAPSQDATELERVLSNPAIGGFEVCTLKNQLAHEVNLQVEEFLSDRRREDLVLLYISSHGVKDDDGRLYFAVANTRLRFLGSTAVSSKFIDDQIYRCRSRKIILVLDCCYSGAFTKGLVPRTDERMGIKERFEGLGRIVLTASNATEYSFEGAELVAGAGQPSVFTGAFVRGLETGEADLNEDGHISVDELYEYIYGRVRDETPSQTPGKWAFGVQGELYIARSSRQRAPIAAEVPSYLRLAIESPISDIRYAVIAPLAKLMAGSDRHLARAAERELQRLAGDDSRMVSAAAIAALATIPGHVRESPKIYQPVVEPAQPFNLTLPLQKPSSPNLAQIAPKPEMAPPASDTAARESSSRPLWQPGNEAELKTGKDFQRRWQTMRDRGLRLLRQRVPSLGRWRWVAIAAVPALLAVLAAGIWVLNPPSASLPRSGELSLGVLHAETGALVTQSRGMIAGVRLAMQDINAVEGIGRMIKLDEANVLDSGDLDFDNLRVKESSERLLSAGVDVIIGPPSSTASLAVIDRVTGSGRILFSPSSTSKALTGHPDRGLFFRTAPPDLLQGRLLGQLIADDGNRTALIVFRKGDAYGEGLSEDLEERFKEKGGAGVATLPYDGDDPEYGGAVQSILSNNPDAVVLLGFEETAELLVKMVDGGVGPGNKKVYGADSNISAGMISGFNSLYEGVNPQGHVLAGMKGTALFGGPRSFLPRLRKIDPSLPDSTYAPQAYDAVVITALAAAMARSGEPEEIAGEIYGVTRGGKKCTSFAECMRLVKGFRDIDIDYDGISGRLEFTDAGEPSVGIYGVNEIQADGRLKVIPSEEIS